MVVWINRVVLKRLVPNEPIPEVTDLQEIDNMLAERVVQWTEKWKQEGLQQGLLEGKLEGLQLGEEKLLERQLTRRFGPLNEETRQRLQAADLDQLERWADNILDAQTLEDVFKETML